jgi:hypothetical protein
MFLVEGRDLLWFRVFENSKSTLVEIRDEIILVVDYDRVKNNLFYLFPKDELPVVRRLAVLSG